MSILIVEDDEPFLELIALHLRPRPVRFALTFAEAKRKMVESSPDVVLLDLSLPDSSPAQTLDRIAEVKTYSKDATVIIITGDPDVYRLHNRAVKEGADCVLNKDDGFFEALDVAVTKAGNRLKCTAQPTIELIERTVKQIVSKPFDPKIASG